MHVTIRIPNGECELLKMHVMIFVFGYTYHSDAKLRNDYLTRIALYLILVGLII